MSQENKARLDFFQLNSPATKEHLDKFRPTLLKHFDQAVDDFYGYVAQYPHLKEKFKTDLTYVKGEQKKHWMNLFSGTFPAEYFEKAQKIGFVHSKINLEPTWYVGGYAFFLTKMAEVIISNFKGKEAIDIMKEVIKVSLVDMELALTYYIKSSDEGKLRNQLTMLSATLMDASQYATTEVMGNTEKLINLANEMTKYIDNVGRVSEENLKSSANSSEKINAVVSTSRELSAAIKEISDQVGRASHITNEAVEHTNMANDKISELVDSANTIGEVIKMINKIASQTNLLALNATIEAARAGEAGRGFAVVASEVKNLANQTEKATQEITAQVSRIQDVTNQTFEVFKNVGKTVNEVSQISTIISGAVEEQNAATSEIASHIENVSTESLQNQERAKQVQDVAAQTSEICKNVKQSAELIQNQMSDLKNNLQGIVKQSRDLDRRTDFRTSINADGRVRTAGGNVISVKIMDLTETGAKTSYFSGAYLGAEVDLDFPGIGFIKGMVRHIEHNQSCGIELKSDASQRQQIVNYLNGIEKRSAA